MRKTELVAQVSERTGLTKKDASACVDAVVQRDRGDVEIGGLRASSWLRSTHQEDH